MASQPAAVDASSSSATAATTDSVTAADYIESQMQLESEAREALPYSFDACTRALGVLRQNLYSCKTCAANTPTSPPPFGVEKQDGIAALCYSCSIACHSDHDLVELFGKGGFRCDCGTSRVPGVKCNIRKEKDVEVEEEEVEYGQNFWGRFCTCEGMYDAKLEEGVMHQCLLGAVCQEDWFHDTCLVGREPPKYILNQKGIVVEETQEKEKEEGGKEEEEEEEDEDNKRAKDLGYPEEFYHMICWKCLDANPTLKHLANYPEFFVLERKGVVNKKEATTTVTIGASPPKSEAEPAESRQSQKRKVSDLQEEEGSSDGGVMKRARDGEDDPKEEETSPTIICTLPTSTSPLPTVFSLLLPENFRDSICRCPNCFQTLRPYHRLLEEEELHEPAVSRSASPTGSILEEGERALNSMPRVQAIEGAIAYNKLKERVKAFLEPFAKSGKVVGAEDIAAYFQELKEKEKK